MMSFMVRLVLFVMDSVYMFTRSCNNVITAGELHSSRKLGLMGKITKIDSDSIQSHYHLPAREFQKLPNIGWKLIHSRIEDNML